MAIVKRLFQGERKRLAIDRNLKVPKNNESIN